MLPTVIISHSLKDEAWKNRLAGRLSVLEREGHLATWNDGLIRDSVGRPAQLEEAMAGARAVVCLLSPGFLASDLARGRTLAALMARRQRQGVAVMPVIVHPCSWQKLHWLGAVRARPLNGTTLGELPPDQAEEELSQVAAEILEFFSRDPFPGSLELRIAVARQRADRVFTPGGPVLDRRWLYGRDELLDRIAGLRREGGARIVLYGPAGSGKSSLLKIAAAAQIDPVFFWSARAGNTFAMIARAMLEKLAAEGPSAGGVAGRSGRGSRSSQSRLGVLSLVTPDQVAAALWQRDALAIVDAFDKIGAGEKVEFTELIARLANRKARLTLILAGRVSEKKHLDQTARVALTLAGDAREKKHLAELVVNYPTVESSITDIMVAPLPREALERIVDQGFASLGIAMDPAARQDILKSSAGQARAVHQYCLDSVYALEERIRSGESTICTVTTYEYELAEASRPTVG
jgi:hypothetical protein